VFTIFRIPFFQMTFFLLIIVLAFEQLRPLPVERLVLVPLRGIAAMLEKRYGGRQTRQHHEKLVWSLLVGGGTVLCALFYYSLPWVLSTAFAIAVLYLTLGFRHESHFFTDIHFALRAQDLDRARALLGEWRGASGQYESVTRDEIAQLTIEQALSSAHRSVFAVVFWFVIFGPCGAVLYRLTRFLHEEWGVRCGNEPDSFGKFSCRAFMAIDWLSSRVTAILFAVGGNFEDAVFCWRTQAALWPDRVNAILVASGAGALGVRLESPSPGCGGAVERSEVGVGEKAGVDDMQTTVGLVWRALIVCLVLLALTTVAVLVGSKF
jgi:adenosylcobinamide-phosphate synthase